MITIELTDQNAERFKLFMKHYDAINEMIQRGVFEVKNGHVVLYFSHIGRIMEIELSTKWRNNTKRVDKKIE